jgi:hypothetical protein
MKRKGLSGVYIFYKFEYEDKRKPTCFEDCPVEKQDEYLNSLEPEAIKNLAKHLAFALKYIGDEFDLVSSSET